MDDLVAQTGSSPQRTIPSQLVAIIGLAVMSASIGLANWALFALSGPNSSALPYAWAFLATGAFLTGLVVGYLMRGSRSAVLTGFLCALVPSLAFSFVVGQGSRNPIGWLLFVLLFTPMDVLAIVSAFLGRSLKPRMLGIAVLIVLLFLALVGVSAYTRAPTVRYGDIVLTGNETMTIKNSAFQMHGNISLSGNASMTIIGGEFDMMEDGSRDGSRFINLSGNSKMHVKDSTLRSVVSYGSLMSVSIILHDNANLTSEKSAIIHEVTSYDHSTMLLLDSTLIASVYLHNASTLTASGSTFSSSIINVYEYSQINISRSDVDWIKGYGNSNLVTTNSDVKVLWVSEMSHPTLTNSSLYDLVTNSFRDTIVLSASNVTNEFTVDQISDFFMSGTVAFTPLPRLEFNGTVTRNYSVNTLPNIGLNVTNSETHTLFLKTMSSSAGTANFDITFTAANYTNTCLLNQKPFDLTSTTPLTYP